MAGKIAALSAADRSRIASGQVIVDMVSVVKELVENSVDAGATSVHVQMDGHGFTKVTVRDNGPGIEADDIPKAVGRYWTSKLASFTDLESVTTFGFRGEALASLCQLGALTIATRVSTQPVGMSYSFDRDGAVAKASPVALGTTGTTVVVENLFGDLPARKKAISTPTASTTALRAIVHNLQAVGLVRPDVQLTLKCNGMSMLNKPATHSLRATVASLFPGQALDCLVDVSGKAGCVRLSGLLPPPDAESAFSSSDTRQFIFINKRPVVHKALSRQLKAMLSQQHQRKVPLAILFIDVPPALVDVNVTPAKDRVMMPAEAERDLLAAAVIAAAPLGAASAVVVHAMDDEASETIENTDNTETTESMLDVSVRSSRSSAPTSGISSGPASTVAVSTVNSDAIQIHDSDDDGSEMESASQLTDRHNSALVDYRLPKARLRSAASAPDDPVRMASSQPRSASSSQSSLLKWSMGHVDIPAGVQVVSSGGARRPLSGEPPAAHDKWRQDTIHLSPAKRPMLERPASAPRNRQVQFGAPAVQVDTPSPLSSRASLSLLSAVDCPVDVATVATKALAPLPDPERPASTAVQLLGPLCNTNTGRPLWAALQQNHILALDPAKLQESILMHSLLAASRVLTAVSPSVTLTRAQLSPRCLERLLGLNGIRVGSAMILTSALLVGNGLEIRRVDDPDESAPRLVLSKLDMRIPELGVAALEELFGAPDVPPESFRVAAVRAYCASEAARMAAEALSTTAHTAARLADWLHKANTLGLTQCAHGFPFVHDLGPL